MQRLVPAIFWGGASLVAMAIIVPIFGLDRFIIFMPFTFSPRVAWIGLSLALAIWAVFRQSRRTAMAILCMLVVHTILSPIGFGEQRSSPNDLTFLSFNTHNPYRRLDEFVEFCRTTDADIVCFQEIQPAQRNEYINALPEYEFFAPDSSADFENKDPWSFSCLTGFRRELLADIDNVRVSTGITGYRTFAVQAELNTNSNSKSICVVNVHTTKPVTLRYGLGYFIRDMTPKARRHQKEHELLDAWLVRNCDSPAIVAGDFNAPSASNSLRFSALRSAQRISGSGLHLTFPAKFPVYGLDHILGNNRIRFSSYHRINTDLSDHFAQVARFGFAD